MSVQPCEVTGWISSGIMRYILEALVNKQNVLSSSIYRMEWDKAMALRWMDGSFISNETGHCGELPEIRSFLFLIAVYDSAVAGADNDQLWASLSRRLRDLVGTLNNLIMTLHRCGLLTCEFHLIVSHGMLINWQFGRRQAPVGELRSTGTLRRCAAVHISLELFSISELSSPSGCLKSA